MNSLLLREARRAAAARHRANRPRPDADAVARIQAEYDERMNRVLVEDENDAGVANVMGDLAIAAPPTPLPGLP